MQKAATFYVFSAVTMGCLALAAAGCSGSSGERPAATGGTTSSGGAGGSAGAGGAGGTGGTTTPTSSSGLNCAAAVAPANGMVTDFTDWSSSTGNWGSPTGLYGSVYSYAGPKSTKQDAKVEGDPKGLHLVGSVAAGDYGGGGLSYSVCSTVVSFSKIEFTITGSAPGCDLELQIQTFDERPAEQSPPGGCTADCYGFPVFNKVVDLSTPITTPLVVTKSLSDFANWSAANAAQVVGLQWQFTGTNIDPDAGAGCPIDVTISSAKFLP